MYSHFDRLCCSHLFRYAAVMLIALTWSGLAFGGEIQDAARDGNLEQVKTLLKGSPDLIFTKDENGSTPLHMAALGGHKDIALFLLTNKADVNAKNNYGMTPLHVSALKGYKEIAELLLANQADVNAQDSDGETPLNFAKSGGFMELAESLRQHGGRETKASIKVSTVPKTDAEVVEQNKPKVMIQGILDKNRTMVEPKIVTSEFLGEKKTEFEQRALWHCRRLKFDWANAGDSMSVKVVKLTGSFGMEFSMDISGSTPTSKESGITFTTVGKQFRAIIPETAITPWEVIGKTTDGQVMMKIDINSKYEATGIIFDDKHICILEAEKIAESLH